MYLSEPMDVASYTAVKGLRLHVLSVIRRMCLRDAIASSENMELTLRSPEVVERVAQAEREFSVYQQQKVAFVSEKARDFAPPCSTFSIARFAPHVEGHDGGSPPSEQGNTYEASQIALFNTASRYGRPTRSSTVRAPSSEQRPRSGLGNT